MSNSFIILTALNRVNKALNTIQISEIIVLHTKGRIYKISATLKDSLEHGLKHEGYVEGLVVPAQKALRKPVKMSLYLITPKSKKVLEDGLHFYQHVLKKKNRTLLIVIPYTQRYIINYNPTTHIVFTIFFPSNTRQCPSFDGQIILI
jgi:hypothetical protein